MKNIKIKKYPVISIAFTAITISLLFTACLKDKGPVQDFSQSPALVSFQYSGFSAAPFLTSIYGQPTDSFTIEVTLSVSSITLSTPVTATIAADDATLSDYNTANGTDYVQLSSDLYTLPNDGKVTISPGQQIVSFTVHFHGDQIDFDQNNALALKITDATGATVATNLNTAIFLISLRNPYEGNYNCTGYFVHPAAPRSIDQTGYIYTISLIRSKAPLGDLGGWYFAYDTNPNAPYNLSNWEPLDGVDAYGPTGSGFLSTDNAVNDPNYPGPPYVSSTYNNTWDPATQTFWMHYGYNGSPGFYTREIYEEYQKVQ
jgi:Domain of unknown function (DUF1735)